VRIPGAMVSCGSRASDPGPSGWAHRQPSRRRNSRLRVPQGRAPTKPYTFRHPCGGSREPLRAPRRRASTAAARRAVLRNAHGEGVNGGVREGGILDPLIAFGVDHALDVVQPCLCQEVVGRVALPLDRVAVTENRIGWRLGHRPRMVELRLPHMVEVNVRIVEGNMCQWGRPPPAMVRPRSGARCWLRRAHSERIAGSPATAAGAPCPSLRRTIGCARLMRRVRCRPRRSLAMIGADGRAPSQSRRCHDSTRPRYLRLGARDPAEQAPRSSSFVAVRHAAQPAGLQDEMV
jgi:hypothetical protein